MGIEELSGLHKVIARYYISIRTWLYSAENSVNGGE
jgi:hypothetical protein